MWSLKDDEYQTYDDQPLDELGVQQEAPEEEEEEVVGGDGQQEDDNDATAQDSQNFETEMVREDLLCKCVCFLKFFLCVKNVLSLKAKPYPKKKKPRMNRMTRMRKTKSLAVWDSDQREKRVLLCDWLMQAREEISPQL